MPFPTSGAINEATICPHTVRADTTSTKISQKRDDFFLYETFQMLMTSNPEYTKEAIDFRRELARKRTPTKSHSAKSRIFLSVTLIYGVYKEIMRKYDTR